jgi:teichuronic acid biosynthesis glycosyltransferase TuaC
MLRVLTLSTLYPNARQPQLGLFVERQTRGLAALPDVEVEVVAGRGLPVWPLSFHPHYRPLAALPREEQWGELKVHRPRFTVWPRLGEASAGRSLARAALPLLRRIRERFAFDIIDAEFFWPDGVAAMHLARALDLPFSVKARGSDIYHWGDVPGIGEQVRAAAEAADGLLAVSQSLKDEMVARGMPSDEIRVHHTGVDLDLYRPLYRPALKAELEVTGPLIVTVGALIERKGQRFALDAIARIPGATIMFAGDGPDRKDLAWRAEMIGFGDGEVRFLGAQPPHEVARILAAADVMLLPTRAEGIANVWVEALACGTPIVTCEAGGAREVIDRPEAGRVVAREAEPLAQAVGELLANPPDPLEVRRAAERFSWERNARELREHLASLLPSRLREGAGEGLLDASSSERNEQPLP